MSSIAQTPEGFFLNVIMGEYVLGLMPKGTHEWDQLINIDKVESYLQKHNFSTVKRSGVIVSNPLTMEMVETSWLRSNYILMARAP
jgi:2-polyprenyl-3-methyl-5-hydroxy-6-metoxy-1,4-benzoquinol methylase